MIETANFKKNVQLNERSTKQLVCLLDGTPEVQPAHVPKHTAGGTQAGLIEYKNVKHTAVLTNILQQVERFVFCQEHAKQAEIEHAGSTSSERLRYTIKDVGNVLTCIFLQNRLEH